MLFHIVVVLSVVVVFRLDSVGYMLHSFLAARGSVLVIKLLPSIKI
jgi:hypothetical protein